MPHHEAMTEEFRHCLRECQECAAVCSETVTHCLMKGGKHAEADHIRLLLDCVQVCATSAGFLARVSPRHERTCAVCAEVCDQCAQDCERMGDDDTMRRCAETCRRCADSCRHMAGAAA